MKIVAFLFLFPSAGKRGRREKVVWLLLSCSPLETHVSALAGGNQGREPGKGEALSPAMPPHTRCVTHREKGGQLPARERPPQKKSIEMQGSEEFQEYFAVPFLLPSKTSTCTICTVKAFHSHADIFWNRRIRTQLLPSLPPADCVLLLRASFNNACFLSAQSLWGDSRGGRGSEVGSSC